ncbi:MAG: CHASE3 domain-containing protein [Gemmatimonadota bacterium]|nr:CHASE3 domain-containing protein [Gemmatimonadota bacterium]
MSRIRATTVYSSVAFASVAVVVLILIVLQCRSSANVEASAALVERTMETQRALSSFGNRLTDAETGQRGYLLTGIPGYLRPYEVATQSIPGELQRLKALVGSDPNQLSRVARLDTLSQAKLAELIRTVRLANEGKRDSALQVVRTNVGDSLMQSIRVTLGAAVLAQDSLISASESNLAGEFSRRRQVSAFLAVLLAIVVGLVAVILRRMRRYQNLVTLCAWSKAVNYEGEWLSFEEYLERRFGLSATHGISPSALESLERSIDTAKE